MWAARSPAPDPGTTARPAPPNRFVGLARQRRQPLDLLRVGDQHLPAVRGELLVHEPRTVHRLHDRADRLAVRDDPTSEPVQAVAIRDRRDAVDQPPLIGDQAHVNSFTTQIQTNMQHEHSSPARGRAGWIQPTAYLDTGWSVLCFGWPAARGATRARLHLCCSIRRADLLTAATPPRGARLHRIPKRARCQRRGWLRLQWQSGRGTLRVPRLAARDREAT